MFGIWQDLANLFGIIRARQLPLALRLPNPLITRKLVDWQSENLKLFPTLPNRSGLSFWWGVDNRRRRGGWLAALAGRVRVRVFVCSRLRVLWVLLPRALP